MPQYTYQPLASDRAEIRLLVLHPGSGNLDIQCDLTHVLLSDEPIYEALSYTWGDPNQKRLIYLQGHQFHVTNNLYIALSHLRNEKDPRYLWIDAVCINQNDLAERSKQVQKMRDIYRSAFRVLAWLGEAADSSDLAMKALSSVDENTYNGIIHSNDGRYRAVRNLFRRSYWTRIWVMQELVVAKNDPIVGCGRYWVPWAAIRTLKGQFQPMHDYLIDENDVDTGKCMHAHISVRQAFQERGPINITSLLGMTAGFLSTDPRDMLYALLGMALDDDKKALIPDYAAPFSQVCKDLAAYILNGRRDFRILSMNRLTFGSFIPSWAPDIATPAPQRDSMLSLSNFQVAKTRSPHTRLDQSTNTLFIRGRIFEDIALAAGPFADISELEEDSYNGPSRFPELLVITSQAIRRSSKPPQAPATDSDFASKACWGLIHRVRAEHKTFQQTYGHDLDLYERVAQSNDGRYSVLVSILRLGDGNYRDMEGHPFSLIMALLRRTYFTTPSGLLGIGPADARPGDLICSFNGSQVYYVLRAVGNYYQFIGDAFLYGMMDGSLAKLVGITAQGFIDRLRMRAWNFRVQELPIR